MRDLGVLKERIEFAERHLSASHAARERESEALMAMWRQIRDRFEAQEAEIARYRGEVSDLTGLNDELSALVDRLIGSIEGNVQASAGEIVPEVAGMAADLLRSEPAPAYGPPTRAAHDRFNADALAALETDDPLDLGTPLDEPLAEANRASFSDLLSAGHDDDDEDEEARDRDDDNDEDDDLSLPAPVAEDSGSPGIRDLISRIEGAVSGPGRNRTRRTEGRRPAAQEHGDLARDLQEIESLRNELSGLRNKIAAGR